MTIDKCINDCEQIIFGAKMMKQTGAYEYHTQLVEWLRELKKWRALKNNIFMLCDVDCEYPQYRESGTMCDACPIGTVKEYFEQKFCGEVNADEVGKAEILRKEHTNEVLEKIKADIIKYLSDYDFGTGYQDDVAKIIDKYIEGSESK